MRHSAVLLLAVIALALLSSPAAAYNDFDDGYFNDMAMEEAEESSDSSAKSKMSKHKVKVNDEDIYLGHVELKQKSGGGKDSDEALSEFTLTAGSHINLRLWQFCVWQIGFVIIGMCLCGLSVLIFSSCCK